jgi:hypothetical protein
MPKRPEADQSPRHPPATPAENDDAPAPVPRIEAEEDADGIGIRPGG